MKKLVVFIPAVLILGWVLAACSMPPTEEMNRAIDAVIRAESDPDAVIYAPNSLIRAREALARMQSEADARRFDSARNYAAEAIRNAERAVADGQTGLARARDEAANLLNSLTIQLAETTSALNAARQVPGIDLDFGALFMDLDFARQTYDDAWQSFHRNNFPDAIAKAQAVRSILAGINSRINEAAQATSLK